ncbi:multiple sugar transport system permease protein [Evansella vedderi]|uniref:Multiple sugar transport system permease protein n=1 Tax=Evansella vedderi TaxID=38282 RepID=A0ABT9ZRD0_9BACI|nr:carbohydrate ABC transporter permease [Evansella vedderi]MDQ0253013.1 multiple sugar transport system permease protein [Evansella vedderi]
MTRNSRDVKQAINKLWLFLLMSAIAIIMLWPFIWMTVTSFKPNTEMFAYPPTIIPNEIIFDHYVAAWKAAPWERFFFNTAFVAGVITFSSLFLCAITGYAFARLEFPGRNFLFILLLASMMIPFEVMLIPLYLIIVNFPFTGGNGIWGGGTGLLNTYSALIVPRLLFPFGVFLMRQFFLTLPKSLEDAARIDGCSEFGIFWRVMFPLIKPASATLVVFVFSMMWDDFFWPLIVINDQNLMPVQLGLQSFQTSQYTTDWGPLMAATVWVSLPIIIVFIFAQKYFMNINISSDK